MRKRLFWWEAAGFLFVGAAGPLLHFLYEWTGESLPVAAIAAVNESTWEHMKILFVPLFVFSVVQMCFLSSAYPNFLAVRAASALTGLLLIPTLFYTYSGILGTSFSWVNVAIFYLADLGMFLLDFRLLRSGRMSAAWQQVVGLMVLWGLMFCFVWCTFRPPQLGLWQQPLTECFGT